MQTLSSLLFIIYHLSFLCPEELRQLLRGASSVTDCVLLGGSHLGEAAVVAIGLEDGIVAEALMAVALAENGAGADAFEEIFLPLI